MRARMALAYANIDYEVREVVLRDKPECLLQLSSKGTVPVMHLDQLVLEESIDIIDWALSRHDPLGWRGYDDTTLANMRALVDRCETEFKPSLDRYKYADRYPERSRPEHRRACEIFIQSLEDRLAQQTGEHRYLFGSRMSYADVAIMPFIRQFSLVDSSWFDASSYPGLQQWLQGLLRSELFLSTMKKYSQWHEGDPVELFSQNGKIEDNKMTRDSYTNGE
jgi:glutathione S-transferase